MLSFYGLERQQSLNFGCHYDFSIDHMSGMHDGLFIQYPHVIDRYRKAIFCRSARLYNLTLQATSVFYKL